MSAEAAAGADARDMGTAGLAGRAVLEISVVRSLSGRSNARGLLRFAAHLGTMTATGLLVWVALPYWYLLIPAMVLHGFTLVTMFAPMHECVHKTAFATSSWNEFFGWIAGLLSFYNFTYYRYYHTWHHRYTQDPEKDPELQDPKPHSLWDYAVEISGVRFWLLRPWNFLLMATGRTTHLPYVPPKARWRIAASAAAQLGVYLVGLVSIALGYTFFLYWFFLPALLAQPLLRAILLVEHTGCSSDENGLTNTRTTLTMYPVRLLMWNMPYHTEHHLYPSIPFHRLPEAHAHLKARLAHLSPSYVAANREVIQSFQPAPTKAPA